MPQSARILLIEDELQIRKMLKIALTSIGYQVLEAGSRLQGSKTFLAEQPDLVILDLGLPDGDGMQVLRDIRAHAGSASRTPVLVLSVRNSDHDKVQALDLGAQDYVSKPFSIEELLARVRAQLRDHARPSSIDQVSDGHLWIDLTTRRVTLDNQPVELTPKEFKVLALLTQQLNNVLTSQQLLEQVWGPTHREHSHYLRIVISHLRQKLGDDPTEPKYLRTEAGVGYRLLLTPLPRNA